MIEVNEKFSIKAYQFGWELHTKTISEETKKGFTVNITYHPNLIMICNAVIDKSAKGCDCLSEIVNAVEKATTDLKEMIDKVGE